MDTLSYHYYNSVFFTEDLKKQNFWNPERSWTRKNSMPWYVPDSLSDAWHIFKTTMIFSVAGIIILYDVVFVWWLDFILLGVVWNGVFNVFYNKVLVRKKAN
jgi:hypothetical protein